MLSPVVASVMRQATPWTVTAARVFLGCGPVHDIEPRHTRELALVGGHEGCAMSARLRGDQQVVMADRRAGTLELHADRAGVLGIGELEWQRFDIQCEQRAQRRLVARPLCALLIAVDQLEQRNGRDTDALAARARWPGGR